MGGASNALYGGIAGSLLGGPLGAITGAGYGGIVGAGTGSLSGAGQGAGTYYVRKKVDKLRGSKSYSYDYSSGLMDVTLEFARGKDKKTRKKRTQLGSAVRSGAKFGALAGLGFSRV